MTCRWHKQDDIWVYILTEKEQRTQNEIGN